MSGRNTLYLLHCGVLIEPNGNGGTYPIQVPCYLIVAASGKRYLVDTGNPAALIGADDCQPWYPAKCEITQADDPIARLAALGIAPGDIDAIIATHFDFDHAGRYDAFGPLGTDVWVQRAHIGAALSDRARFDAHLWNVPGLRWRQVHGDHEIEPGLTLLRTDGHAVGHQSIVVETEEGPVILAADAIDSARMAETRQFPDYYDADATNCSIDRLLELSREQDAPIIFGHDYEQWSTLPHSPEPYSRS
ncbi:MAG TPA: N-acyl homoserine lactonase family protein [Thermomicrobiales bacterium]|nr:N-acyl homoserine lactonase family protein [Thermomicrobiales bacterium]